MKYTIVLDPEPERQDWKATLPVWAVLEMDREFMVEWREAFASWDAGLRQVRLSLGAYNPNVVICQL